VNIGVGADASGVIVGVDAGMCVVGVAVIAVVRVGGIGVGGVASSCCGWCRQW